MSNPPLFLSYSQLTIASGDVQEFYKKRKQEENVRVVVSGDKIPMYGSGASLTTPEEMTDLLVTLGLEVNVGSRAHVLGKLVKHRFYNKVECFLEFATTKLDVISQDLHVSSVIVALFSKAEPEMQLEES